MVVKCQPYIPEAFSSIPALFAIEIIYPALTGSESRGASMGTSVSTSALPEVGNSSGLIKEL